MSKKNDEIKAFNVRLPKELWVFLKNRSAEQEEPMGTIIMRCIEKYKKRFDDRLTDTDTKV